MTREPDCEFCGGKTPPDNHPLYYTTCHHEELCPKIWAWKLAESANRLPVRRYVKEFDEYVRKVRESERVTR
jgi:hypothetical protein